MSDHHYMAKSKDVLFYKSSNGEIRPKIINISATNLYYYQGWYVTKAVHSWSGSGDSESKIWNRFMYGITIMINKVTLFITTLIIIGCNSYEREEVKNNFISRDNVEYIVFDRYIGCKKLDSVKMIYFKDSVESNYMQLLAKLNRGTKINYYNKNYITKLISFSDSINIIIYDIEFTYFLIYIHRYVGAIYIKNVPHYGDDIFLVKHPLLKKSEINNLIEICKTDCLRRVKKYKQHDFVKFEE